MTVMVIIKKQLQLFELTKNANYLNVNKLGVN